MTSPISSRPGKLILAVETSTALGSVALIYGQKILQQETWQRQGSHSEYVTTSFDEILKAQKLGPNDIDCIAVGVGPGSFTGVRVAVNFARALAFGISRPIFAMNSLHLLAHQPTLDGCRGPVIVLQYGFRDIFYIGEYRLDEGPTTKSIEVRKPRAVLAREIDVLVPANARVIGDGLKVLQSFQLRPALGAWVIDPRDKSQPEASFFSRTLVGVSENLQLTDWIHTVPLYIRASEAEEKMRSSAF